MASVDSTRGKEFHQERFQLDKGPLLSWLNTGVKDTRKVVTLLLECFEETMNLAEDTSTFG